MSTTPSFGTVKQVAAILFAVAIVLAAGVIVGQAPEIFGAEPEDPQASIEFADQTGNGSNVTIDAVELSGGGFVVVTGGEGETLAVSTYLESGEHENVTVEVDEGDGESGNGELFGTLRATVHRDTDGNESYDYGATDGEADLPYLEDGYPVSDTATVTMADREGDPSDDSFVVESIDAPSAAGTSDTIEIVAEVRNPTTFESRQAVELRIDGAVHERQVLDLAPDETSTVTFEIDLADTEPGNRIVGVYTAGDGALSELELEFDGPPSVSVVDADPSSVTVDAGLPGGGFVAVEDADGDVLGTSEALDAARHENVTIDLDGTVETNETLTAVAYEGDPADLEEASAYEVDGERVAVPVVFEDAGGTGDGDGEREANDTDDGEDADDGE